MLRVVPHPSQSHSPTGIGLGSMTPSPGCPGRGGKGPRTGTANSSMKPKRRKRGGKKAKKTPKRAGKRTGNGKCSAWSSALRVSIPALRAQTAGARAGLLLPAWETPPPKLPIPPQIPADPWELPPSIPSPAPHPSPGMWGCRRGGKSPPRRDPALGGGKPPKPQSHQTHPKQKNLHPAEQDEFVTFTSPSQAGGPRATSMGIRASYFWDPPG